jgi:zinc transporter 2
MGAIKQSSDDDNEINTDNNLKESLLDEEKNNNISQEEMSHNINADDNPVIRAAYIHILGDMIQSAGVLIAAFIIYFFQDTHPGVRIVDPICTFCFAIVVLCTTFPVSRDCFYVLLESTPRDLDIESLYNDLSAIEGVISVHDIHLWNISIGRPSIALHIICENPKDILKIATQTCKNYGIKHCTIQTETKECNCKHEEENDIH